MTSLPITNSPEEVGAPALALRAALRRDIPFISALAAELGTEWLRLARVPGITPQEAWTAVWGGQAAAVLIAEEASSLIDPEDPTPFAVATLYDYQPASGTVWFDVACWPGLDDERHDAVVKASLRYAFSYWPIRSVRVAESASRPSSLSSILEFAQLEGVLRQSHLSDGEMADLSYRRIDREVMSHV